MKTQLFLSAALILLFSSATMAFSPKKEIVVNDAFGRILTMPVIVEQAVEENLPFDLHEVFVETRLESLNTNIDISDMIKPEAEVNDLPQGLLSEVDHQ